MGCSGGTTVMSNFIEKLKASPRFRSDTEARKELYGYMIDELEDMDWDCQEECIGDDVAYDAALKEKHPDWEI
jgi:hypothetical protein